MTTIKPTDESIKIILENIHRGRWVIPNFQRDFTWTTNQVKELLESILQSYYIGAVLVWKCRNNKNALLAVEPVYGTGLSPDALDTESIILDGQQRLTSIYYAKYSPDKPLKLTKSPYVFFIELDKIINNNYDDFVFAANKNDNWTKNILANQAKQFQEKYFPINKLDDYHRWLEDFKEHLEDVEKKTRDAARLEIKIIREHLEILDKDYRIAVIELPENMRFDHVCEIFERINSKGTTLTVFDLLNARLLKGGIELRRKLWGSIEKDNQSIISRFAKDNSRFPILILQILSLNRKSSCKRRDLIELTPDNFIKDWNNAVELTKQTLKIITNHRNIQLSFGVIKRNYLPYQTMIPILAVLLKENKNQKNIPASSIKISRWYWASVFTNKYAGSTDSQIAKDYRQMKEWFKDESKEIETIKDAKQSFKLNLQDETRTGSAVYKGVLSLIVLKGANDFSTGNPPEYHKLNDHHIFPKGQVNNITLDSKDDINSILNRTLISEDTNLKGELKKLPRKYLKTIELKIGKQALLKILETHFINAKCYDYLLNNNFREFIKERARLIEYEIRKKIDI
ncbi:hypothetical protein ES705_20321 [subsurface metagenome]